MRKVGLVFGFGVSDADYVVKKRTETGVYICPYYQKWYNMIRRCNSEKYQELHPTYKGCAVSDEWKSFMSFRKWMKSQDWEGKCLDKDIISPGNKLYAEDLCCFVDHSVNCLLLDRKSDRGMYPVGVSLDKERNKFFAYLNRYGKRYVIGRFSSVGDASRAYAAEKSKHILQIASKQKDERVASGLAMHAQMLLEAC